MYNKISHMTLIIKVKFLYLDIWLKIKLNFYVFILLLVLKLFCRIRCLFELHNAKGNLKISVKKILFVDKKKYNIGASFLLKCDQLIFSSKFFFKQVKYNFTFI